MSRRTEARAALLALAKVDGVEMVYRAVPVADQAIFPHAALLGDDEDRSDQTFQRKDVVVTYSLMFVARGPDPDQTSQTVDDIIDRFDAAIEADTTLGLGVENVHRAVVTAVSIDRGVTINAATFAVVTVRVEFRRSRGTP